MTCYNDNKEVIYMALFGDNDRKINFEEEAKMYGVKLETIKKVLSILQDEKMDFEEKFRNRDAAHLTKRLLEEEGINSKVIDTNDECYLTSSLEKEQYTILSKENVELLTTIRREIQNLRNKSM